MIMVCDEFQDRLDRLWCRLQTTLQERLSHSISQYDMDGMAVDELEQFVDGMERQTAFTMENRQRIRDAKIRAAQGHKD